jgi:hypothetical protein
MKVGIILLSILAMAITWLTSSYRQRTLGRSPSMAARVRIAGQSLVVGVAVYFGLMLLAMLYLLVTTA